MTHVSRWYPVQPAVMDSGPDTFGSLLCRFRAAARLSQEELARRAGLSARGISDLEREVRRAPRRATVDRLSLALGLDEADRARLDLAATGVLAPRSESEGRRPHLPAAVTSFVGREQATAELRGLVRANRLVTVTGPPGIGKTRLALQVASGLEPEFQDGVVLVELAPIAERALVEKAVASALTIQERRGQLLSESIARRVGSRAVLLVMDNCEHVVEVCATLLATLLTGCPRLHILATSRQSLRIGGETTYSLSPLELPNQSDDLPRIVARDAVRLLVERARSVLPTFEVTRANARHVVDICWRLDGIPLAIELAAVWVRALGIDEIALRLQDRLGVLTSGHRAAAQRHQTLRRAIEWSYELLSEPERQLLGRLGAFAGGWTLEAVDAIAAGDDVAPTTEDGVIVVLASLIDKSLVISEHHPFGVRYRMLETLRQYAAEQLASSADEHSVRERHRLWCVRLAERGEREIWRRDQLNWVQVLAREQDNMRAALRWSMRDGVDPEPGLRIAAALGRYWDTRGDLREGIGWLRQLLSLPTVRPRTPSWGRAMTALGYLTAVQGDSDAAVRVLDEALSYWREVGEPRALAVALFFRGMVVGWPTGDLGSMPFFEQSLELSRLRGPYWTTCFSLAALGEGARVIGDRARATALLEEALALAQVEGERHVSFFILNSLALQALSDGHASRARTLGLQALPAAFELGNRQGAIMALDLLGSVAAASGELRRAARLFGAADASRALIGDFAYATARANRAHWIAVTRARLGDAEFAQQSAAGRTLSLDEAVHEAQRPESKAEAPVTVGPAGLSAREVQVLQLLTEGHSNREIAEHLVISDATVKRHLENLYAKLGVSSRTAAAAAALRSSLTVTRA